MTVIQSRFEFRTWGDKLEEVQSRMEALSECQQVRESIETYVVSTSTTDTNPKVRDGQLDIKVLVAQQDGFEQWEPRLKANFPVPATLLRDQLFPLLGKPAPVIELGSVSLEQFLDDIVGRYDGVEAVEVTKRRRAFTVGGCIAEVADVSIGGKMLQTAAVESVDIALLRDACRLVGLDAHENINYPAAIKTALGWAVA